MAEQEAAAQQHNTDLRGEVAIVTGASSGIGEAITEALVSRGVNVAIQARRAERLQALAGRPQGERHGEMLVVPGDVRRPEDVQALVNRALERWGRLDIVIANAGFGYRKPVVEGDIQVWKDMLDTNVYGLLLTLKYGVQPLLDRKRGHVVVTSSVAGINATPGGSAYCGSKAAASFIADCLRQEVASQGVRVTTIEPGVVISEFQAVAQYTPEVVANMLKGAEPLYPVDIARLVLFALEQPAHVGVSELVVRATGQAYP
jgi:NADP-dependent 3-hydroxy acid dehydrogenase YdfG